MRLRETFQFLSRIFKRRKLKKRGLSAGVKRKTGETRRFVSYFEGSRLPRLITGVAFVVLAVLIIWAGGYYYWPRLTVGQRAMEDVYASIDFTFRDDEKTFLLRQEAAQKIPQVYTLDDTRVAADLDKLIGLLRTPGKPENDSSGKADLFESVSNLLNLRDSEEIRDLIATENAASLLEKLKPIVLKACRYRIAPEPVRLSAEQAGIEVRSVSDVQRLLRDSIQSAFPAPVNTATTRLLEHIADYFTNVFEGKYSSKDPETLKKLQAAAMKSVVPQFTSVQKGTKIIERGEEISPRHIAQIEQMRRSLSESRSTMARLLNMAGTAMAVSALVIGSAAFLARFHRSIVASNSRLILIALSVLTSMGISKLLIYLRPASVFLGYPIAIPFGSFVLSMTLGLQVAAFVTLPMAVLVGMGFGSSLSPALVGAVGGWAAAFFAGSVRHRKDFIRTGAVVGLVNGLMIAAIGALTSTKVATLLVQAAGGVAVAMGSILLASVFLPLLEWAFKIPTNVTLVELTDSNHPLLKRMVMEAPGTYYHSLMVGNLAESAAEAVGASPLLARVGSYFHDIGKLKKPLYFSENEAFGRSKHDTLNPNMSNLIILSHVKDGVDLACKHKLNKVLIDMIKQHHGTSLNYYFYRRAEDVNGGTAPVDEKDFRYPGPRPQSRESAIIMLADAAEAASRSLEKPTTAKIRAAVRNIIRTKFEDGQLDQCDLTLKDLHKIEETFSRILVNTLHPRVKYPEEGRESRSEPDERPVPKLPDGSKSVAR
jgi:putative nucleotidyltransferase with HDIG domain